MTNNCDMNNKLNNLILQASQTISCDSTCQKEKTKEDLKKKYLDAQMNEASASSQVQTTKKNYVTFTEGTSGYNTALETDLTLKATTIADLFQTNFNTEVDNITSNIDTLNGLLINYNNVVDLYNSYKIENKHLHTKFKNNTSDVLTNERKTYYQEQGVQNLNFYYYVLLVIYIVIVIIFLIFIFIFPSSFNWKILAAIFVGFVILPFISTWLLSLVVSAIYVIYGLLPKNIHLSL
jgi:hypothetical protein